MTTTRIGEHTLDDSEEWLVRNALACYRDTCKKCADAERAEAERNANAIAKPLVDFDHLGLAREWDRTVERIEALEETFG